MPDFATNTAARAKKPIYVLEFLQGDTKHDFESTAGASLADAAANLDTSTTARSGTGSTTFDKVAGNVRATVNFSITEYDRNIGGYERVYLRLPSIADVLSARFRIGSSSADYHEWTVDVAALIDTDWNRPYLSSEVQDADTAYLAVGIPIDDEIDYFQISVLFSDPADTLSGILVDLLTLHPQRYSTAKITTPRTTTAEGWMRFPSITPNEHDTKTGQTVIGQAGIPVVDGDAGGMLWGGPVVGWGGPWGGTTVIADLDEFDLLGRECALSLGYRGEVESNTTYERIYRGVFIATPHTGRAWSFSIIDMMDRFRRPAMQDATEAAPVTIGLANVITLLLQLALSTGNGTNNPTYDVLSAANGAGIDADLFDVEAMEEERDSFLPFDDARFTFVEPIEDLLEFIFTEVFLPHGIVPIITREGRFSIRVVRPAFGVESTTTFDSSNILGPGIPDFNWSKEDVVNQVRIEYDYDEVADTFASFVTETNAESVARFGVRELPIQSRGIRTARVARRGALRIINRLGDGAPPVAFQSTMATLTTELGDLVTLTKRNVPDIENQLYNIEGKLTEVFIRGFDPATAKMNVAARITSFRQGNYRVIAPASVTADYAAQTQFQKDNYGSIATAGTNLLGGSDPAHEIGPG